MLNTLNTYFQGVSCINVHFEISPETLKRVKVAKFFDELR